MMKKIKRQKQSTQKVFVPPLFYCLIIISVLIFIYYYEIILQKKFLWDDVLYQWYPLLTFTKEHLKTFRLPVWNPYVYSGVPYLNDLSISTFYPINWFFLFLNKSAPLQFIQIELIALAHLLLTACFVYLFLKELKIDWQTRIYGAIIMTFSGYVSLRTIQITPISVFAWSFLIFYFFVRILTRGKFFDVFWGGIFLGIAIFGGHPQFWLYLIYSLILFYIYYTIVFKRNNLKNWLLNTLIRIVIFFLIGLGIAMVQYYPSFKYVPFTVRAKTTFEQTTDGSLLPKQLLCIFLPKFFGSVAGGNTDTVPFWAANYGHYYWESGIYLGVLPIFLALFGVFYSPRKIKYAFLIISILALLFALGKYFPLYKIFWYIIPGLNRFRFPVRFLSIYTIATGILSILGLEYFLLDNEKVQIHVHVKKFSKYILFLVGINVLIYLLFLMGMFKNLNRQFSFPEIYANSQKQFAVFLIYLLFTWLFFVLRVKIRTKTALFVILASIISFIDLYQFGNKFSKSHISPTDHYVYSRLIIKLQQERQKEIFRIKTREDGYMLLKRNESILWKLEAIEGYTSLPLERYLTFNVPTSKRNEILNVKYSINIDTIQNRIGIIVNPKYLPRAFFCYNYLVVQDDSAVLGLLRSDSINLRQTVILEEQPQIPTIGPFGDDSVSIQNWQNDYIQVHVKTTAPGFLVLSEIFYPEWCAKIDGQPTKIYCADYLLRAVYVPEGEHTIEMYYSKRNITIGALISLI
ncbi:MAG: hypothetical protein ABIL66_11325, partial [candidate division WOR-3 bacterium]